MRRRAFTLIEVIIMSVVGLMLLGIVYSIFISSSKDSAKMNRKLQAIQAGHLLLERLENDIKQAFYLKGVYDLQVMNHQGGFGNAVAFYRLDPKAELPGSGEGKPVKVERIEYIFSPVTARVYINGKPFTTGLFKRVEFSYKPSNIKANPPVYADTLTVTVTGIPDELAKKDISEIDERDLATLVSTYSFRARAIKTAYPAWNLHRPLVGSF